jgi:hypothetical protein
MEIHNFIFFLNNKYNKMSNLITFRHIFLIIILIIIIIYSCEKKEHNTTNDNTPVNIHVSNDYYKQDNTKEGHYSMCNEIIPKNPIYHRRRAMDSHCIKNDPGRDRNIRNYIADRVYENTCCENISNLVREQGDCALTQRQRIPRLRNNTFNRPGIERPERILDDYPLQHFNYKNNCNFNS